MSNIFLVKHPWNKLSRLEAKGEHDRSGIANFSSDNGQFLFRRCAMHKQRLWQGVKFGALSRRKRIPISCRLVSITFVIWWVDHDGKRAERSYSCATLFCEYATREKPCRHVPRLLWIRQSRIKELRLHADNSNYIRPTFLNVHLISKLFL